MGIVVEIGGGAMAVADASCAAGVQIGRGLAVIVPTFNERDNIAPLIRALDAVLPVGVAEIIFVDDWSSDGTAALVAALARERTDIRLVRRYGRRGLASAVIEGMLATTAPIVAVVDADLQHDEAILPALVAAVAGNRADVAIGSRYREGGSCADWPAHRVLTSRIATRLARLVVGGDVTDPLSGYFVVRRDLIEELAPRLSGRGFKLLIDILASSPRPLRVCELPYHFRIRQAGTSKLDAHVTLDYLRLLAAKSARRLLASHIVLFGVVGLSGLAVNLAVLDAARGRLGFAHAQSLAVIVAIGFNFMLNNRITFRDQRLRGWLLLPGLASFYLVCGLGALANVGVATAVFAGDRRWWLAGLAGAIVGSGWNFLASSALTWRTRTPVQLG